jgi:enoyl-CoA hydratase/carnithine racemase
MADGSTQAPLVLREDADGIATLTLNRPAALNALSEGMMSALQAEFDALATDATTRVVVIRAGGRAFCAGHDLREMQAARAAPDGGRAYFTALFAQCARMMTSITRLPQPVIAEAHGLATAAGCQLVATCDMAVAAAGVKFGVNGVNIGLFCSTPMVALTRNIPAKQAFEMLTTGEFIDAERALRIGLVNRVVPADTLGAATRELAATVAGKLAVAVRIGKRAFYEQAEMTLDAAYAHTGRVMAENMLHRDTDEGVSAFLEKRPPRWS